MDDRRGTAPARAGLARAGAAEPRLRRLPATPRRRHRRLGRRLAGHDRPRQPRGAVARDRAPARTQPLARADARAAAPALSRARRATSTVGRRRPCARRAPCRRRAGPCPRGSLGAGRARSRSRSSSAATLAARARRRGARPRTSSSGCSAARGTSASASSPPPTACAARSAATRSRYVVTRNIQYTNVCYFRCGFCAFSKGKLAENLRGPAYLVPMEEIVRRSVEAWERAPPRSACRAGSTRLHRRLLRRGRLLDPGRGAGDPRPRLLALEVWQGAATLGLSLDDYLARLRDLGLGSLPGTAAEILDDEVRARDLSRQGLDRRSGSRCTTRRIAPGSART